MDAIFIYLILGIILFAVAFVSKRHFGLLGLSLSAGSILSGIWSSDIESTLSRIGFSSGSLTWVIVAMAVILLPPIILLFHGPIYKTLVGRLTGAVMFSFLAVVFLIEPISHAIIPRSIGVDIYNTLVNNQKMIIGVGLIVAVIDIFFTKRVSLLEKKSKH